MLEQLGHDLAPEEKDQRSVSVPRYLEYLCKSLEKVGCLETICGWAQEELCWVFYIGSLYVQVSNGNELENGSKV